MQILELLADLGLPSACVGTVIIAIIFKRTHAKISTWAAVIALVLMVIFAVIQFVEVFRGSDVSIGVKPAGASAFTASGHPVNLEISVTRKDKVLATRIIEKLSESTYQTRPLVVNMEATGLTVSYGDYQIGLLAFDRIRTVGWRPAEECAESGSPHYWYTNRVHAGQTLRLGETDYGTLKICAISFTESGEAKVALELAGHGEPIPAEVVIRNKGLGVQSFLGIPEFYIAVREADFTTDHPWAAFSVFSLH
ncbi:MAG: hypothetical protein ACFFCW_44750 [Candidatus Hodarchaeota archaeon]